MCLELYTFELLQPTNLLAHVARERERESKPQKDGKVFQGCCRQYFPIIFRFPTLLSILGLLYYVYIYIYIMTVCATPLSPSWQAEPEVDKDPKRAPQRFSADLVPLGSAQVLRGLALFFTTLMVAMMCLHNLSIYQSIYPFVYIYCRERERSVSMCLHVCVGHVFSIYKKRERDIKEIITCGVS